MRALKVNINLLNQNFYNAGWQIDRLADWLTDWLRDLGTQGTPGTRALGYLSHLNGNWAIGNSRLSKGTWVLRHSEHLGTWGTWALEGHLGTWGTWALEGQLGTRGLEGHLNTCGIRGTLLSRIRYSSLPQGIENDSSFLIYFYEIHINIPKLIDLMEST